MNFPEARHIPRSPPGSALLAALFLPKNSAGPRRSLSAPEQSRDRPKGRGGNWFFWRPAGEHPAKSGRKPCARAFARAPGELARARISPPKRAGRLRTIKGISGLSLSSERSRRDGRGIGHLFDASASSEKKEALSRAVFPERGAGPLRKRISSLSGA